jgi:phage baseplate assembly protein W
MPAPPTYFGYNFPFYIEPDTVLPPQADVRIIKNDLLQLLLTSPGERRMRPDFGTPLRTFPFEPSDVDSLQFLRRGIVAAIRRFEPRVITSDVIIQPTNDGKMITVTVLASLTRDPNIRLAVELVSPNPAVIVPTQQAII